MALNFSHRPIFQSHLSEDMLFSPGRIPNGYHIEGIPDMSANDFGFGRDKGDRCGSQESISKDVIDLLPSDPFDMDITTTITGWFENFDVHYGGFGRNAFGNSSGEYNLFTGLNLYWTNVLQFKAFPTEMQFEDIVPAVSTEDGWTKDKESINVFFQHGLGLESDVESSSSSNHFQETDENVESNSYGNRGESHDALQHALRFLGVRDLLSVEGVCRSLRSTVQTDSLLWMTIDLDHRLNEKITDDILLQLTSKVQGKLQSLCLIECPRITDDGIKRVLETNLQLTKLSVPGCARLSVEGIVSTMKKLKSEGTLCIKHLRIGGLCGMTGKHFEDLKLLLGTHTRKQQKNHRPRFYRRRYHYDYLLCDDDLPIDIEECPKCQRLGLVYDCPLEGCQGQSGNCSEVCRACRLCIPRCVDCGCCINGNDYEETFCLEWRCSYCYGPSFIHPGRFEDDKITPFNAGNILSKKSSCCG